MTAVKIEDYEGISTVSRARSSNVATIIVSEAHGLASGDTVTISGLGGTGYNDEDVEVTVTTSTAFTYANTGADEGVTADTAGSVYSNMTFPYNPNTAEFVTTKFVDRRNLPYSFTFLGFTNPIRSSISIALNGHFSGTNKNSDYRKLASFINRAKMVKLYFENTHGKFYLCSGMSIQKVPTGLRPMHVDYVAVLMSPFGMLFASTQKSGAYNSSEKNEGNIDTPIESITGSVTIDNLVTIKDASGNGFKFTPSATGTMVYSIVRVTDSGSDVKLAEYMHVKIGTAAQALQNADNSGDIMLRLKPGQSLNDIFATGTISGITTETFYFRNGWSSD